MIIEFRNDKNGKRVAYRDGRYVAGSTGRLVRMNYDEAVSAIATGTARGYNQDGTEAVR